jgi:hypothetical protein
MWRVKRSILEFGSEEKSNMEKEFIPYEQALVLKELGFDEYCFARYYQQDGNDAFIQIGEREIEEAESAGDDVTFECDAPLYQQAFRWFREKYNLISVVGYHNLWKYSFLIETIEEHKTIIVVDKINTYEEAELECLKKLIEIVKEKFAQVKN